MARGPDSYKRVRRPKFPAYCIDGVSYKKCSKCLEDKTTDKFDKAKCGLYSHCMSCRAAKVRRLYHANPEKVLEYQRRYRLKYVYGLSLEAFDLKLKEQDGRCAICDDAFKETGRDPHVDHDHITQDLRGLLCHMCNHLLGSARDNVVILDAAKRYLDKWRTI